MDGSKHSEDALTRPPLALEDLVESSCSSCGSSGPSTMQAIARCHVESTVDVVVQNGVAVISCSTCRLLVVRVLLEDRSVQGHHARVRVFFRGADGSLAIATDQPGGDLLLEAVYKVAIRPESASWARTLSSWLIPGGSA